jgi:hypothetical protein
VQFTDEAVFPGIAGKKEKSKKEQCLIRTG